MTKPLKNQLGSEICVCFINIIFVLISKYSILSSYTYKKSTGTTLIDMIWGLIFAKCHLAMTRHITLAIWWVISSNTCCCSLSAMVTTCNSTNPIHAGPTSKNSQHHQMSVGQGLIRTKEGLHNFGGQNVMPNISIKVYFCWGTTTSKYSLVSL